MFLPQEVSHQLSLAQAWASDLFNEVESLRAKLLAAQSETPTDLDLAEVSQLRSDLKQLQAHFTERDNKVRLQSTRLEALDEQVKTDSTIFLFTLLSTWPP